VLALLGLLFTGIALSAVPDEPAGLQRLRQFLAHAQSLRAEFRQEVSGGSGKATEASSGRVAFRTPGRFRWT
jgi:outer membrane lipoprotein-sorting protein